MPPPRACLSENEVAGACEPVHRFAVPKLLAMTGWAGFDVTAYP